MQTKHIYTGIVVNLNVDTVTLPNGLTVDLEVVRHPGAAAVVPLKDDGGITSGISSEQHQVGRKAKGSPVLGRRPFGPASLAKEKGLLALLVLLLLVLLFIAERIGVAALLLVLLVLLLVTVHEDMA